MSESFVDLVILAFFGSVLVGVSAVGILALPWKDDELVDTVRAIRGVWRRLDDALRAIAAPVAPARPKAPFAHRYLADGPTVALEPPSMAA